MLVLSRMRNETILIGDDIAITVSAILGHKVKLAIVAPPSVRVDRLEVRDAKDRELREKEGRM